MNSLCLCLAVVVVVCSAYPTYYYPQPEYDTILLRVPRQTYQEPQPLSDRPRYTVERSDDLEVAADTPYAAPPVGRVKIQVYRGPNNCGYGEAAYGKECYAPQGFYITEPGHYQ